jgi:hypothetical protein
VRSTHGSHPAMDADNELGEFGRRIESLDDDDQPLVARRRQESRADFFMSESSVHASSSKSTGATRSATGSRPGAAWAPTRYPNRCGPTRGKRSSAGSPASRTSSRAKCGESKRSRPSACCCRLRITSRLSALGWGCHDPRRTDAIASSTSATPQAPCAAPPVVPSASTPQPPGPARVV